MFEKYNEYRDKTPHEKEAYKSKVFLILSALIVVSVLIAYGVVVK